MKSTGQALLNLAAFVATADDSLIDPDTAVKCLERLVHDLNSGDPGERAYLKGLMRQEIASLVEDRTAEEQARVEFYLDLMESMD